MTERVRGNTGGFLFRRKVGIGDLVFFTKQLAAFLQSGVSIADALGYIAEGIRSPTLSEVVLALRRRVLTGLTLAQAMRAHPEVFNPLYVGLVEAGERAGKLDLVLKELAEFLAKERRFVGRMRSAMAYPAIVLALSVVTVYVLLTQMMPKFRALAEGLDVELPWISRAMFAIGDFLASPYFILTVLGAAGVGAWYMLGESGPKVLANLLRRVPMLERVYRYGDYYRFCSVLSLLKRSGIPLNQDLRQVRSVVVMEDFRQKLSTAALKVENGFPLSVALIDAVPPLLLAVIRTGENTGRLDELLKDAARYYEELLEETLEVVSSLVQPVLIVVVGGVVLFILAAVFLPYGTLLQGIQNLGR